MAQPGPPDTALTRDPSPLRPALNVSSQHVLWCLIKLNYISAVEWINFLTPLKISRAQLQAFRMLDDDYMKDIVDNFRPPQPLNGRTVRFWA